jgi:hypothetical protein
MHQFQHAVMHLPSLSAQYVSSVIAYQCSDAAREVWPTEVGALRCRTG